MAIDFQNFYETTTSAAVIANDTYIPLTTPPTVSEGWLLLDYDVSASREFVYFTSKDATGVFVTPPNRGRDGTTAVPHLKNAKVRMDVNAGMMRDISQYSASLVNSWNNGAWAAVPTAPTSVTYNGNRSYTLGFGADYTGLVSPGNRLKTTRTVNAPTQSTLLNGTNQYWSKSAPTGLTFTDDFAAGAWIKLTSYSSSTSVIMSRYNGTSGWSLQLSSGAQVVLTGYNAGFANRSEVSSLQSIPLNKWVHITAQLDMSAFTTTTTTSYVMIDGVDVPTTVARFGTNPTALVQAGNLEVGSSNGGLLPLSGEVAQAFVTSAKVTQSNVKTLISQGITSALITSNNIISAYSFDGVATDLNTTSANNLSANGSATATNADSPFGGQANGTISATLDHAIVQKVTASTMTVQVAEGCTIPTSGGVASAAFSSSNTPFGFPKQEAKWTIIQLFRGVANVSWSGGSWTATGYYFYLPAGDWKFGFEGFFERQDSVATVLDLKLALSISPSTAITTALTDALLTTSSNSGFGGYVKAQDNLSLTTMTQYFNYNYIASGTSVTGYYGGQSNRGEFKNYAVNAFL